jgi:hypothetical protein
MANPVGQAVPQSVRQALYSLMENADDEVLPAAYLVFLMAPSLSLPGAEVVEQSSKNLDGGKQH